jgi:hypothetical protein
LAKTVLKQIMSYAIRHDFYAGGNPVAEVDRLGRRRKKPVGLNDSETEEVRQAVRSWRHEPGLPGPRPTNALADMGKEYDKVTEIVMMGMESLLTGTNGGLIGVGKSDPDREFRDFVLGAVASAGGRNSHERPRPAYLQ